jgi:NAD(P)-dependent dehydrogenase (short-subunit alcohol dehydrogenase family)
MRDSLTGKVAIVTGASRGIGAAIARRFAAEGARVAMVARSLEPGSGGHLAGSLREVADDIAADGGIALPIVADLSDPACDRAAIVAQTAAAFGPVDVLVNNAAACFYLSIDDTSERRLRVAYEVNAITPYLLAKAAVPAMRDRGAGWIVNIASVIADSAPPGPGRSGQFARASTYAPSKASINRLTEALATELGGVGIAVNAVAPEMAVATEGATAVMDLPPEWCEPIETMAEAALALATCDPAQENGQVLKSGPYLRERGRVTRTLDGRETLTSQAQIRRPGR